MKRITSSLFIFGSSLAQLACAGTGPASAQKHMLRMQAHPMSLIPYPIPAYSSSDCPNGDISSVVRIHVKAATLLSGKPCDDCFKAADAASTGADDDAPNTEKAFTPNYAIIVPVGEWSTPFDINLYGHWKSATDDANAYRPILIEIILDDASANVSFIHPTGDDADSSQAVRAGETADDDNVFTCLQNIAADHSTGSPVIKFRTNYVEGVAAGLNLGILVSSNDGTTRLPIYIDPRIGNNGVERGKDAASKN